MSTLVGMTKHNFYIIQVLECKQLQGTFFFSKRLIFNVKHYICKVAR